MMFEWPCHVLRIEPDVRPGWWLVYVSFDGSEEHHASLPVRSEERPTLPVGADVTLELIT